MTQTSVDQLGPVDHVVVEFPRRGALAVVSRHLTLAMLST